MEDICQGIAIQVLPESIERALKNVSEHAAAREFAAVVLAQTFHQGEIWFDASDHRSQIDELGGFAQMQPTVFAADGIYPALLGQDLRDFHQMRLGNAKSFCNFTDGAQAFMVRACINKHAQCIVSKCGEAHRCKASQEERDRLIGLPERLSSLGCVKIGKNFTR